MIVLKKLEEKLGESQMCYVFKRVQIIFSSQIIIFSNYTKRTEAVTREFPWKKLFLKILQHSQKDTLLEPLDSLVVGLLGVPF